MLPQGQKLCAQTVTATFKHTQNARILCLLMGSDGSGGQNKDSMIQTGWISKIPACESPSFQTLGLNMWNLRLFFLTSFAKLPGRGPVSPGDCAIQCVSAAALLSCPKNSKTNALRRWARTLLLGCRWSFWLPCAAHVCILQLRHNSFRRVAIVAIVLMCMYQVHRCTLNGTVFLLWMWGVGRKYGLYEMILLELEGTQCAVVLEM